MSDFGCYKLQSSGLTNLLGLDYVAKPRKKTKLRGVCTGLVQTYYYANGQRRSRTKSCGYRTEDTNIDQCPECGYALVWSGNTVVRE